HRKEGQEKMSWRLPTRRLEIYRAVGQGFIPGIRPAKPTRASAPAGCFLGTSSTIRSFSSAGIVAALLLALVGSAVLSAAPVKKKHHAPAATQSSVKGHKSSR